MRAGFGRAFVWGVGWVTRNMARLNDGGLHFGRAELRVPGRLARDMARLNDLA